MSDLEKIMMERYAILLGGGKNKKPRGPKRIKDSILSNNSLFSETERLRQKSRDSEIDVDQEGEEDFWGLIKTIGERETYKNLEELNSSVDLLSNYISSKNEGFIKKKIYKISNLESKIFNKNFIEKDNYITNISKNFSNIQTSPFGLNLTLGDSASITADNIGEFVLPIVEYIQQTQPDYVVASDRGARLLGLAVFKLYNRLYGRFPTADGTLRFRRFSKSNTQKDTEAHLRPLVDEMLQYKKRPTVLVLDDWVCSGGTKRLAQDVFDKLGKGRIKTKFGVLVGEGGDVSGHSGQTSGFAGATDWRDDSDIIGVRYGNNNYGASGIRAQPVRSEQAIDYRRRMYEGIDKLAERISEEGKEAVFAK